MTALYHADVQLGLGLVAVVEITEHDPAPPPQTGAEWAAAVDWPIAELEIRLPRGTGARRNHQGGELYDCAIADELRGDIKILNEKLNETWGHGISAADPQWRRSTVVESAEYLDDAVRALRRRAEADLAPLIAHVAKRAERLALRERTLMLGRAGRGAPAERPIELDAAPRGAAAIDPTTIDDSSQRFALLELDAPAEQPVTTTSRKTRRKADLGDNRGL